MDHWCFILVTKILRAVVLNSQTEHDDMSDNIFFCLHQYSCQLWGYLDKKVTYIFRLSLFLFPAYLMLTWPNHYNLGIIGKIFSPIELEYKWCQFGKGWWHQKWNKLIMACYGYHRHQWVKVEAYNLKLNSCFGSDLRWTSIPSKGE